MAERRNATAHQDPPLHIDPGEIEELLARRAVLIAAVRSEHPGLTETPLIRVDDITFIDNRCWDSAEAMQAALRTVSAYPEVRAAMSLTRDRTAEDGDVVGQPWAPLVIT
jgi:hypothetical protein